MWKVEKGVMLLYGAHMAAPPPPPATRARLPRVRPMIHLIQKVTQAMKPIDSIGVL